jgi:hypothetical protein
MTHPLGVPHHDVGMAPHAACPTQHNRGIIRPALHYDQMPDRRHEADQDLLDGV